MSNYTVYLQKSTNPNKKYMVTLVQPDKKNKTIHFGASGYSDYTKHKDPDRMKKYDSRHKPRENWSKSGIKTAGFWSKWILWSKSNLKQAIDYTSNKFNIKIIRGAPPKSKSRRKSPKKTSKSRRKSPKKTAKSRRKSPKKASKSRRKSPKKTAKSRRKSPKKASKSRRKSPKKASKFTLSTRDKIINTKLQGIDWFIVTMEGCGYCDQAKKLLETHKLKFKTQMLTKENQNKIYESIDSLTKKYRYFPVIFYKGKFLGGYTELKKKLEQK